MTTAETHATDKAAAVAAQGTHDAPEKAPSKRVASKKKGAPKAKKTARLPKPRLPPRAPKARGEDPGDDRPRQGCPRRHYEGHRMAGRTACADSSRPPARSTASRSSRRRTRRANVVTRLRSSRLIHAAAGPEPAAIFLSPTPLLRVPVRRRMHIGRQHELEFRDR
jgi:hypothetical protein